MELFRRFTCPILSVQPANTPVGPVSDKPQHFLRFRWFPSWGEPVLNGLDGVSYTASQPRQRALSKLFDIALSPPCSPQDALAFPANRQACS